MANEKRVVLAAAVGLAVVFLITLVRSATGADTVVSQGLGGPGFLGAMAAFVTWWITASSKEDDD